MNKILKIIIFAFIIINIPFLKVNAIALNGVCGLDAGCPAAFVGEPDCSLLTPADGNAYKSTCLCEGGNICALQNMTTPCTCQKALGAGLIATAQYGNLNTTKTIPEIIGNVIKVILGMSGTIALIFIIWGGIQWMISQGEPEKIKNARKLMQSGMIAIIIIAAAYAITSFVISQITVVTG